MVKKLCSIMLSGVIGLSLIGCGSKVDELPKVQEKEFYEVGEMVELKNDTGTYKFSVLGAKILPATEARKKVLQISYTFENIDFNGVANINGVDIKGIVNVDQSALKVKDENGYILSPMNSAWGDDWKSSKPAAFGEKCIAKYTFILEEDSKIENTFVSFSRLDKEFKVTVEQ